MSGPADPGSTDGHLDVDVDVLVVGCGPVGVMAALRCAQRGLSVMAVDRSEEIYPLPRAIGMDAEIQSLFDRAGLIEPLRAHSSPLLGGEFVNASGERVVGIEHPPGAVGALGHPAMVMFDQPGVERFLRAAAVSAAVDVRLGVELCAVTDLEPGLGEGVAADLQGPEGDSVVRARWLIGADGARSTVRALRSIDLVDQGYDQAWLVVDATTLDPHLTLPHLARQICDPARICTFVPGTGNHRRWEFRLNQGETRDEMLEEATIQGLLARWGSADQLRIDRAAVYRFHATVADRFRDGPVFLAGDAAHQMPPFNGQGMCTGMRDAENLSWKLAAVADGRAGIRLLDTYDEERRPHAADQVAHAVDAGMLIEAIATDGKAALGSGYGQRPFPGIEGSLLVGEHRRIGHPLPAPVVEIADLPDGWILLRTTAADHPDPELWNRLGATVRTVPPEAFPDLVADGRTTIVRPDRYVAAVTDDLVATSATLAPILDR